MVILVINLGTLVKSAKSRNQPVLAGWYLDALKCITKVTIPKSVTLN